MTDTVKTQKIIDGRKKAVLKFTNISDGTGESDVAKVDVSELSPVPVKVSITRVWYFTAGMSVQMYFDATTNLLALGVAADDCGELDMRSFGGIPNDAGTGITGDILFTTIGHSAGDTYTIILEVDKSY